MRLSARVALALLLVACDGAEPSADGGIDAGASAMDAGLDASLPPSDAGVGPDPSCLVPDVSGESIAFAPSGPRADEAFTIFVTGAEPRTNVGVRLCTSSGSLEASYQRVSGGYTWEYAAPALPAGEVQVVFFGDPSETVYSTARLVIADAASDAGVSDAGPAPDLCAFPSASLIDGRFDEPLSGLAPPGWQVRDPGAPGRCGTATDHVHEAAAPPGCGGRALAVDARGSWDCYAIQTFTDYGTITEGRTYRVSASVRAEGNENPAAWFFLGVQWLDASDGVFGDEKNPRFSTLNYEWRRLEWDLVAPPGARRAVVWLSAHYDGRVDVDGLAMMER